MLIFETERRSWLKSSIIPALLGYPGIDDIPIGRPDVSNYLPGLIPTSGVGLVIGGHIHPEIGCWETLDPYDPGPVTYRARLEEKELASTLSDRFNVIYINAVFEHINPIHYKDCVENLYTMTKPGGLLEIEVPWLWSYHTCNSINHFGGDFSIFTQEGLRRMFEEHPATNWVGLICEYFIPDDCPDGVGVFGLFQKRP